MMTLHLKPDSRMNIRDLPLSHRKTILRVISLDVEGELTVLKEGCAY